MPNPDDLINGTIGAPYRLPACRRWVNRCVIKHLRDNSTRSASLSPILASYGRAGHDAEGYDCRRPGKVLEDISYGMGPMRGGNYATGGLGTLGQMHPQVLS